jgi:ABC-type Zn uptake system ZnuABC Zn-binding protein ZnuA
MTKDEAATKKLEKFKKEYQKLVSKYPEVMVASDMYGYLVAYHTETYNAKVFLQLKSK